MSLNKDKSYSDIIHIIIMHKPLIIFFLIVFSTPSYAYVDPGTGSIIISAIVGFFAGIGFFIKKYYYKIKNIFIKDKDNGQ